MYVHNGSSMHLSIKRDGGHCHNSVRYMQHGPLRCICVGSVGVGSWARGSEAEWARGAFTRRPSLALVVFPPPYQAITDRPHMVYPCLTAKVGCQNFHCQRVPEIQRWRSD